MSAGTRLVEKAQTQPPAEPLAAVPSLNGSNNLLGAHGGDVILLITEALVVAPIGKTDVVCYTLCTLY